MSLKESHGKEEKLGVIYIEVVEGRNLVAMDNDGTSDPYVVCIVGQKKKKTKIIRDTLNPKWTVGDEEKFKFNVVKNVTKVIIECYDWDRFNADDRMGMTSINITDLFDEQPHAKWFPLVPMKPGDPVSGELYLKVQFSSAITEKQNKIPLIKAIKAGDLKAVTSLLASPDADPSIVDPQKNTPLHLAAASTNTRIITALVNNPRVSVNAVDIYGNTPLHVFAHKFTAPNCEDIIAAFAERRADVNAKNNRQETPLHKACLNAAVKVIMAETLIARGADVNAVTVADDRPIDYAIKLGREDLCQLLVRKGAAPPFAQQISLAKSLNFPRIAERLQAMSDVYGWCINLGLPKVGAECVKADITIDLLSQLKESDLKGLGFENPQDKERFLKEATTVQKAPKSQSFMMAEKKEKIDEKNDLYKKVRALKYLNLDTGSWVIDFESLEFAHSLGKGASGQVYLGYYGGEKVAIKTLPSTENGLTDDEFAREFQIICFTSSPHIVKFFGACIKPRLCIVMEFCEQGSLYDVLSRDNKIGWDKVFNYALGTVKAIHSLHNCTPPIMHRDLKSLNVLVTSDDIAKVCDFGLSRFDTSSNLKTLGKLRGTYHYVAPELYSMSKFTFKSDVYSIGIILWELVNRCVTQKYAAPFSEYPQLKMDIQILVASARNNMRPTIPPSCPESFKDLIMRCYSKSPEGRPTTAELIQALEAMQADFNQNPEPWNKSVV